MVLLGSRLNDIRIPEKTHHKKQYINVGEVIKGLPEIKAGENLGRGRAASGSKLTSLNLKRIRQSKPNGTWREWDRDLLPACYKKASASPTLRSTAG